MLLLDGEPLAIPPRDVVDYVRENIDPHEVEQFSLQRSWTGPNAAPLGMFIHHRRTQRIELNRLYWPSGAVNWGYGYFCATLNNIDNIGADAWGKNGTLAQPVSFLMTAPGQRSDERLSLNLYALPPVPLAQIADADGQPLVNDLFVIPLVSKRYLWQYKPMPYPKIVSGVTTWLDVFGEVAAALGEQFLIDDIEADYLKPNQLLNIMTGDSAAMLLDACAFNVSMRVVEQYNGTIQVMTADTARNVRRSDDASHPLRTLRAGGNMFGPGGFDVYSAVIPEAVQVSFPTRVCVDLATGKEPPIWIAKVKISDVSVGNVFAGQTGFQGTKAFRDLAIAEIPAGGITPTNVNELNALAAEIAEEYWKWMTGFAYDRVYNGIVAFAPDGYLDQLEFTYRCIEEPHGSLITPSLSRSSVTSPARTRFAPESGISVEQTTRAISVPWNVENEELHHRSSACDEQLCGPPTHIHKPSTPHGHSKVCQTLYEIQKIGNTVQQIPVGDGCCVTNCCKSSSHTPSLGGPCLLCVGVEGCGFEYPYDPFHFCFLSRHIPLSDADVTIPGVGTGLTDTNGVVCFNPPNLPGVQHFTGTVSHQYFKTGTFSVTYLCNSSGGALFGQITDVSVPTCNPNVQGPQDCNVLIMQPTDDHVCAACCVLPWPKTLTFTCSKGGCTLTNPCPPGQGSSVTSWCGSFTFFEPEASNGGQQPICCPKTGAEITCNVVLSLCGGEYSCTQPPGTGPAFAAAWGVNLSFGGCAAFNPPTASIDCKPFEWFFNPCCAGQGQPKPGVRKAARFCGQGFCSSAGMLGQTSVDCSQAPMVNITIPLTGGSVTMLNPPIPEVPTSCTITGGP
jgi:hypothetical protein